MEIRDLVRTMVHVLYALIISAVLVTKMSGVALYWILLIGFLVWLLGQPVVGVIVAILSSSKLFSRQQVK